MMVVDYEIGRMKTIQEDLVERKQKCILFVQACVNNDMSKKKLIKREKESVFNTSV